MTNTILIILAVVVGIIIIVKFIRFFVKGIILLALLAVVLMVYTNMTNGTTIPKNTTSKIQASIQNESSTIAQKLLGYNLKQVETNLQNTLTKGMLSAKEVFSNSLNRISNRTSGISL
ncbi:hypothetical protein [Desulfosporosinus sp. SB140]|uniref:hypothetical protein n=1 Tax=Desulfosporosinus paludis TaxID=3115649 RepID=UPI00388E5DD3